MPAYILIFSEIHFVVLDLPSLSHHIFLSFWITYRYTFKLQKHPQKANRILQVLLKHYRCREFLCDKGFCVIGNHYRSDRSVNSQSDL